MKSSSNALQQATGPVGHKRQDQATQTTCEIPRPSKSIRDSADFLKNEVLEFLLTPRVRPPPPNYVTFINHHNC